MLDVMIVHHCAKDNPRRLLPDLMFSVSFICHIIYMHFVVFARAHIYKFCIVSHVNCTCCFRYIFGKMCFFFILDYFLQAFSDPVLSVHPVDGVSGQLIQVTCTVSAVYSSSDYRLDIKLFGKDQLSGSMDKFCDESSFCKHTLSATDQRGGERIDYTCLTEFTVSRQTISKTAKATFRFQGKQTFLSAVSFLNHF